MDIQQLCLSFEGRVGRKTFWAWNLFYYAAVLVFILLTNKLMPSFAHVMLPIFLLVMLYPDLAITAKRWHDRDKSSWWLLLNVPLLVGRLAVPMQNPEGSSPPMMWQSAGSFIALFCGVWIVIECGLLKGSETKNRYGTIPLS